MKNIRKIFVSAAVITAVVGLAPPRADAAPIALNDLNSSVLIDPNSQAGVFSWFVDGTSQLFQQWFWYRVGSTGPEASIDTISAPAVIVNNSNFNPGDDTAAIRYTNGTLQVDVSYQLNGGSIGSRQSDLGELVKITNLSNASQDVHFFQYSDFDLGGTPAGDVGSFVNPNTADQRDALGTTYLSETVATPAPNEYQFGTWPNTLGQLNDGSATTLNNTPSAVGDVTWAFQWDRSLAPGDVLLISKDKRIGVPEPASLFLFGTALIGAAGAARRRKAAAKQTQI